MSQDTVEQLGHKPEQKDTTEMKTFFISKEIASDAIIAAEQAASGGISVFSYDAMTVPQDEVDLINTYRTMAMSSEIDEALQEIRNEIFVYDTPKQRAFDISFSEDATISRSLQKTITKEFQHLYDNVVNFNDTGPDLFDDWYIDGRIFLHKIVSKTPSKGIVKVLPIDPLKIRRVRVLPKVDRNGIYDLKDVEEFFIFAERHDSKLALNQINTMRYGATINGLKIAKEAIAFIDSGYFDRAAGRYCSYLRKAIVPFNNLRMMEDAMLIFRVARAPVRRAIYVDVSNMQKNKADQYMKEMMARFKNKMVFDSRSGSLTDRRNLHSMLEDYWLPRRDGGKGTEVTNIDGQGTQDILEEVRYYREKLWRGLGVPLSRYDSERQSGFVFGRSTEIQRDEYRFKKFLSKLRKQFLNFMLDLIRTQLILKKVIKPQDWGEISSAISWEYAEDNNFVEFKESEILNNRLDTLQRLEPYIGRFFSNDWVQKRVLRMTDKEIDQEAKKIKKEKSAGEYEDIGDDDGNDGNDRNNPLANQKRPPENKPEPEPEPEVEQENVLNEGNILAKEIYGDHNFVFRSRA